MSLHSLVLKLEEIYKNPKPMKDMTLEEKIQFSNAHLCHFVKNYLLKRIRKFVIAATSRENEYLIIFLLKFY